MNILPRQARDKHRGNSIKRPFFPLGGCGALIMGDIKLVKGPNGGEWTNHTNGTISVREKKNGLLRFSHLAVSQN